MITSRPCALLETFVGSGPSRFLSPRRQFHRQPASPNQNTLHPIAKARGHLVKLVLFFQELNRQTLLLPPPVCQQRGHTSNVALATPTTTFAIGFNYQVSMSFSFYVDGMRDN